MAYKEIEPCARALGMKVLILDHKSYRWNSKLEQKFRTLGIADDQLGRIEYELEDQQAVVILKSKKYYGAPEIAPHFSKFDLDPESIHYMNSTNAAKHPVWGDLDATIPPEKRNFLYWIRLDVLDENNDPALEETLATDASEDGVEAKRYKQVNPIEWRGVRGFMSVGDVLEAIDNVFPGQENAILNFGPPGKMFGQANKVFEDKQADGTYCIMTLAPYKNGSRSCDCSIDGYVEPPLNLQEVKKILAGMSSKSIVSIRYKDPTAFGPKAGQVVEQTVDKIDIDKVFGVFMRPREDIKPRVMAEEKEEAVEEGTEKMKYSKKKIVEAIKHWRSVLESMGNDVEAYIGLRPDEQLGLMMGQLCVYPKNGDGARALTDEEIKKYWDWYEKHPVETRQDNESLGGNNYVTKFLYMVKRTIEAKDTKRKLVIYVNGKKAAVKRLYFDPSRGELSLDVSFSLMDRWFDKQTVQKFFNCLHELKSLKACAIKSITAQEGVNFMRTAILTGCSENDKEVTLIFETETRASLQVVDFFTEKDAEEVGAAEKTATQEND